MSRILSTRVVLAMLTFAVVAGAFVQYGTQDETGEISPSVTVDRLGAQTPLLVNANGRSVFGLPHAVVKPTGHARSTRTVMPVKAVYTEMDVPRLGAIMAPPTAGCNASMLGRPAAHAMVGLSITLPCAANSDIVVQHADIRVSARTDADGRTQLVVPALAEAAEYIVLVQNVEHARVVVEVPSVADFGRLVLHWRGQDNMQLHAFYDGAGIGDAGHIWSASAMEPTGARGFVTRLGAQQADIPYLVEVYTYPATLDAADNTLALRIGVAVTGQNCGRIVKAATIRMPPDGMQMVQAVSVALPACDMAGSTVMLDDQFPARR